MAMEEEVNGLDEAFQRAEGRADVKEILPETYQEKVSGNSMKSGL